MTQVAHFAHNGDQIHHKPESKAPAAQPQTNVVASSDLNPLCFAIFVMNSYLTLLNNSATLFVKQAHMFLDIKDQLEKDALNKKYPEPPTAPGSQPNQYKWTWKKTVVPNPLPYGNSGDKTTWVYVKTETSAYKKWVDYSTNEYPALLKGWQTECSNVDDQKQTLNIDMNRARSSASNKQNQNSALFGMMSETTSSISFQIQTIRELMQALNAPLAKLLAKERG